MSNYVFLLTTMWGPLLHYYLLLGRGKTLFFFFPPLSSVIKGSPSPLPLMLLLNSIYMSSAVVTAVTQWMVPNTILLFCQRADLQVHSQQLTQLDVHGCMLLSLSFWLFAMKCLLKSGIVRRRVLHKNLQCFSFLSVFSPHSGTDPVKKKKSFSVGILLIFQPLKGVHGTLYMMPQNYQS